MRASEINKLNRKPRRSAHALQILQQTLHLQAAMQSPGSPEPIFPGGSPDFNPSPRLQQLFERCLRVADESESSEASTFIDYDALISGSEEIYENIKAVWSMCQSPGSEEGGPRHRICKTIPNVGRRRKESEDDEEDDIELSVDYDALVRETS